MILQTLVQDYCRIIPTSRMVRSRVPTSLIGSFGPVINGGVSSNIKSWSRRSLATSKERRKYQEKGIWKGRGRRRTKDRDDFGKSNEAMDPIKEREKAIREEGVNWRPIFFLGVFPIIMSGLIVLSRDDLRQELEQKGMVRLLRDAEINRREKAERKMILQQIEPLQITNDKE